MSAGDLMTVDELRGVLSRLPDDAVILVAGYEGGYDRPVLCPISIDPEPASDGGGVYGRWFAAQSTASPAEWPRSACERPLDAWVLTR